MAVLAQKGMGESPDALPFAGQVHNAPAAVALLDIFDPQTSKLLPTQPTARQQGSQRPVPPASYQRLL
jgi:hypothetical protein